MKTPSHCLLTLALLFCADGLKFQNRVNHSKQLQSWCRQPSSSADDDDTTAPLMDRRTALGLGVAATASLLLPRSAIAAAAASTSTTDSNTQSSTIGKVTDTVVMDVRVSRQDGTFYVRDDLPDTPENKVMFASLRFGLFGNDAPNAVQQFLRYVDVKYDPLDDDPFPSYARSTFSALDQPTGLLMGGSIPSLQLKNLGSSTMIQYGNRILPAPFWGSSPFEHTEVGLLTHRKLDLSPSFGITTRPASFELDGSHVVFGQVLLDDESRDFLEFVQDLPTYSMDRPGAVGREDTALETVAAGIFTAQREFFRSAATSIGDSRVGKVYEGKLLRRVEAIKVTRI